MKDFIQTLPGRSVHNPAVPTHFMWVQPVRGQVSFYHEALLLAASHEALRVIEVGKELYEPVTYIPSCDLCADLQASTATTYCPLKGDASYFDLVDAAGKVAVTNAAWSYQKPLEFACALEDHVAFDHSLFARVTTPL